MGKSLRTHDSVYFQKVLVLPRLVIDLIVVLKDEIVALRIALGNKVNESCGWLHSTEPPTLLSRVK